MHTLIRKMEHKSLEGLPQNYSHLYLVEFVLNLIEKKKLNEILFMLEINYLYVKKYLFM